MDEYRKNGFVILKNFLNRNDVINFKETLRALIAAQLKKKNMATDDPFNDGLVKLDRLNHQIVVELYETLRHSDALCGIVFNAKLVALVKKLLMLGKHQTVYMNAHSCRIDPPEDERFTYKWHQQSYYSIFEADEVQLWTPMIDRNTKEKGTISILLGSHKCELPHRLETNEAGHEQRFIPDEDVAGKFREVFVELDPTDIILFHPYLIHRSNRNTSNKVRYSLIASYANPFDPRFRIAGMEERKQYHRQRCLK